MSDIMFFNFTKFNKIGSIIIIFFYYYSESGTSCATTSHKQPPPIISHLSKTLKFPNPNPMVETSPEQPPLVIAHLTVTGGNEAGVDLVLIQTGSGKSLEIFYLKICTNRCTNLPALKCKSCCSYAN